MVQVGVDGYILKSSGASDIVWGLEEIMQGRSYFSPRITTCFIKQVRMSSQPVKLPHECLTPRQLEVLQLIGQGLSNGEIASKLTVAEKTVCTYAGRVYKKLELRDRVAAVIYAREHGLVKDKLLK